MLTACPRILQISLDSDRKCASVGGFGPILAPEQAAANRSQSGGVLHDSVDEDFSFENKNTLVMAIESLPASAD